MKLAPVAESREQEQRWEGGESLAYSSASSSWDGGGPGLYSPSSFAKFLNFSSVSACTSSRWPRWPCGYPYSEKEAVVSVFCSGGPEAPESVAMVRKL